MNPDDLEKRLGIQIRVSENIEQDKLIIATKEKFDVVLSKK